MENKKSSKEENAGHLNEIIVSMKDTKILDTKLITDKYHTFGELYMTRMLLILIICMQNKDKAFKSKKHFDEENDPMFNGDFVVGVCTPLGFVAFHFKLEFWDLFDISEIERAPQYDGYDKNEAMLRMLSIIGLEDESFKNIIRILK